jgi:hypothetical protein
MGWQVRYFYKVSFVLHSSFLSLMMNTLDDESYSIPSMQTTYFYTIHALLILLLHLLCTWRIRRPSTDMNSRLPIQDHRLLSPNEPSLLVRVARLLFMHRPPLLMNRHYNKTSICPSQHSVAEDETGHS